METGIIRAAQRHCRDFGWLKTCWLFSFNDYYDPANVRFGALHVFNDDIVAPGKGFPFHPHREMEIVTIPLQGELTHEDSTGQRATVHAGEVQRMSAGTGVMHSEYNHGTEPVHLYQIWIIPGVSGLEPSYEQRAFSAECRHDRLCPLASGQGIPDTLTLHADATIYQATLSAGNVIEYATATPRRIFLYLTSGSLRLGDEQLAANDQARIEEVAEVKITAREDTEFVLIDVP